MPNVKAGTVTPGREPSRAQGCATMLMDSVWLVVHGRVEGQPKSGAMRVACAEMVCVPRLRPSMITQYPSVPDGNSSEPTGRPGGPVKNTWPSLPCATTPAEKWVMIDSCRFFTTLPSTVRTMFVKLESLRTLRTAAE